MMMTRHRWYWIAPFGLVAIALFIFLGGTIVQALWNWLAPALFGWREVTFWQAVGLLAICRILFGGLGRHGGRGGPQMHFRSRMTARLADRMADRWDRMTPEEREQFRQRMGARWGAGPATGERTEL